MTGTEDRDVLPTCQVHPSPKNRPARPWFATALRPIAVLAGRSARAGKAVSLRNATWLGSAVLVSGAVLIGSAILIVSGIALANSWQKIDDDNGVQVYSKELPNSPLVAFRGETVMNAPVEKLLWVLADNTHRTAWVDRLEKSVVLESNGPYDYTVYQHFSLPFPISDRDYVYRGRAKRGKGGSVVLEMQSVEHPQAPPTVGVRAHLIRSRYELIPLQDGKTRVIVEVHTDPKGSIPNWLVNLIQESWPMKTLLAMQQEVGKAYVGQLRAP